MTHWLQVVVQTPAHSGVGGPLTYRSELPLAAGTLVRVPLGARETLGVVWQGADALTDGPPEGMDAARVREVAGVLDGIAPLNAGWRQLAGFAAHYYQRALGEVALSALPPALRDLSATQVARRLKRLATGATALAAAGPAPAAPETASQNIAVSPEQAGALAKIEAQNGPFLLFGATGSGKTEVYLQAVQALLARDPTAQALVLVPEINLTPQLEARFIARFGPERLVSLHSGMTPPQRLNSWLAAHAGQARIVLGTRMAIFASMPTLKLIVVDEEHDPSYKQQEGARYSARDLAVYRARLEGAKVVLGSATPSLESWHRSRPAEGDAADGPSRGKYLRLHMPSRIGDGQLAPGAAGGHDPPAPAHRAVTTADGRHRPAHCARRAGHGVPEPARLRPGAGLQRLRLEKPVPALQRVSGVPQDRPQPALPPLRLCAARAARLPRLRQPGHRARGPRH